MTVIFFFNDTATTEIYTLSLHDALPIFGDCCRNEPDCFCGSRCGRCRKPVACNETTASKDRLSPESMSRALGPRRDRKSTRLNSSHANISYAVFCLKKKNNCITYIVTLP